MIKIRHREVILSINGHNTSILNKVKFSTKVSLIPKFMLLAIN